jgi:hypothetical protein
MCDLALLGWALAVVFGAIYALFAKGVPAFLPELLATFAKGVPAFWPALLATFVRVGDWLWPTITAGLIIGGIAVPEIRKQTDWLPAWDSRAARAGAALGAFVCVLFFVELVSALGFPPGLKLRQRLKIGIQFKYLGLFLAVCAAFPAAARPQFQWVALPVFTSATIYLIYAASFTARLARNTFNDFPPVDGSEPAVLCHETLHALHATDVHLIAHGAQRMEGGDSGNKRLAHFVTLAIARRPAALLITGDLTDHGEPGEYEEAKRILAPLQDPQRVTHSIAILLAPGNHDLGTAYNPFDQLIAVGNTRFQGGGPQGTNGLLMVRYLQEAVRLHPPLQDCTGQTLNQRLEHWRGRDARFEQALTVARERLQSNAFDADAISELATVGDDCYPEHVPVSGWQGLLKHPGLFRELYLAAWHADAWYEPFPLRTRLQNEPTEVIILNSVSPDPTLGGSAWGELGKAQLARLEEMLKTSDARRCLILVHHAPFRWTDEVPPRMALGDLQRWGFLPFGIEDLRAFLNILKNTIGTGKDVLLFCGHRHGFKKSSSNPMPVAVSRSGMREGVLVAEGASLADRDTAVIAVVVEEGRLALRTVVPETASGVAESERGSPGEASV